ncbi:AAA family ATPase [Saccharopolyspora sp. NPDC000995]
MASLRWPRLRAMAHIGTSHTRLVVLRGPSGSGKSTTAKALRARLGPSVALVEQDYLRRIVLKEPDIPCGANIGLISNTTRYALEHGWNVILDGIFSSKRYTGILDELRRDHLRTTHFYYFDVSWDETVRRHRTRPKADEFTVEQMRDWYRPRDLLGFPGERIIRESSTLPETVGRILGEAFP